MIYTFIGDDTFESYSYAKNLARSLSKEKSLPLDVIEAESITSVSQIQGIFQSVGMFSESRVILLKRFSQNKILSTYIYENISVLDFFEVILWDEIKKLPANKSLPNLKVYSLPKENEMRYWIKNFAIKFGIQLDLNSIDYFFTRFQFNKWQYFYEFKKLKIYIEKKQIKTVNIPLIEKITESESKGDIWKFLDYLFNKNTEKAYIEYKKLSSHEDVSQLILSLIEKELRNIFIYLNVKEDSNSVSQMGLHPFVLKKLKEKATKFSESKVRNLITQLVKSDYEIKMGNVEQNSSLQNFIFQFAQN